MIAVDTNLLVYAHREDNPFHAPAERAIANLAASPAPWCIPWPCIHEFYSVVTGRRIYQPPSTPAQAISQIEAWLESPSLHVLQESGTHWKTLKRLITAGKISGAAVHDARIAALCLDHGVRELWTADRDFGRFPQLRTRNPLVAA